MRKKCEKSKDRLSILRREHDNRNRRVLNTVRTQLTKEMSQNQPPIETVDVR